jgi:hypothetical protein
MVLAIGHTLRAHKALGCPDALSGFLEVVHRLFEDGAFVGHDRSILAPCASPRAEWALSLCYRRRARESRAHRDYDIKFGSHASRGSTVMCRKRRG